MKTLLALTIVTVTLFLTACPRENCGVLPNGVKTSCQQPENNQWPRR